MATLLELRTRAYALMDEGQSQYLGIAEMNNYVNNAASLLHNIVVTESPWRAQKEHVWFPQIGVSDYPLPADFRDNLRVFTREDQFVTMLKQFNVSEYGRSGGSNMWRQAPFSCQPRYKIMGQSLKLDPAPTVAPFWDLYMWYAPQYTVMVNDTDATPSFQLSGHEQWIINSAVIYAKAKEEVASSDFQMMNEQIMSQILADLRMRDRGCGNEVVLHNEWMWHY